MPQIKFIYGYIRDVLQIENQEIYTVRISTEDTMEEIDSNLSAIPLDQTPEELSSLYGPPSSLIGRRVRVEYTSNSYADGVARIVADFEMRDQTSFNTNKTRAFRYAVAGGGGI